MFKKIVSIAIVVIMVASIASFAYAQQRRNASPIIIDSKALSNGDNGWSVSDGGAWRTYPAEYESADIYIRNYDSTVGFWIMLSASDPAIASKNIVNKMYIGPSGSLDLYNYTTTEISILSDVTYTGKRTASPAAILITY